MLKKFLKKISTQPESKAALAFLMCSVIQKGISFFTTPVFTRLLSASEYGQFSVFSSWQQICLIVCTLSISSGGFTTGLVKYDYDKNRYTSSMEGLSTLFIILFFSVCFLFQNAVSSFTGLKFEIVALIFFDTVWVNAFQIWSRKERVEYRYKKLILISLLISILTPTLGIIFIKKTIFASPFYDRVASVIITDFIIYFSLFLNNYFVGKRLFVIKYWIYALKFNVPLIPHYLSQIVLNQSDRLMINNMVGSDKAGIYSLAYSLSMVMLVINDSINKTLDPWLLKKIKKQDYHSIKRVSYVLMVLVGAFNLMVIILAPELIRFFAPPEYYEAIWIVPPVAASVFFMFMYNFFADFEFYYGKTVNITFASILGAIINVILNYIFIKNVSYIAAGYTTLLCYIIYVIAHYHFMDKILKERKINTVYSKKIIILISVIFLLIVLGIQCLYNTTVARYMIVALGISILLIYKNKILNLVKNVRGMDD